MISRTLLFIIVTFFAVIPFGLNSFANRYTPDGQYPSYVLISPAVEKNNSLESMYKGLDKVVIWPTRSFYEDADFEYGILRLDLGQITKEQIERYVDVPVEVIKERKAHIFSWPEFQQEHILSVWSNLKLDQNMVTISIRMFGGNKASAEGMQNHCFEAFLVEKNEVYDSLKEKIEAIVKMCTETFYFNKDGVTDPVIFKSVITD